MPRLLLAGCGFLGEAAAGFFFRDGWEVVALTATAESAAARSGRGYRVMALDFSDPTVISALEEERFDAVLHCASSGRGGAQAYERIYREGLRNLVEAFPGARIIFTGSTSVYAQADGSIVDESSETIPTRETGHLLLEAERIALDAGGVVLRLAGLYGPGRSVLMSRYLSGAARLEDGGGRWINQIHRDDAAVACRMAAQLDPGIYNVVDDRPATQREVLGWLAEFFGGAMPLDGPVDPDRKRGVTSKRVSNARLRAAGWSPRYPDYRASIPSIAESFDAGQGSSAS